MSGRDGVSVRVIVSLSVMVIVAGCGAAAVTVADEREILIAGLMVSVNCWFPVSPFVSLAEIVKGKLPACIGVPESNPES